MPQISTKLSMPSDSLGKGNNDEEATQFYREARRKRNEFEATRERGMW